MAADSSAVSADPQVPVDRIRGIRIRGIRIRGIRATATAGSFAHTPAQAFNLLGYGARAHPCLHVTGGRNG
jgi:hypothetical protein